MNHHIFKFKANISKVKIPLKLNNPFGKIVSEIAEVAAKEFQDFIADESKKWKYDFETQKGKMFGILVVKKQDNTFCYLGTVSGKLPNGDGCANFIPSVFDHSTDDFFINKGMTELTEIGNQVKESIDADEISLLKEKSKAKSNALQKRLFENYNFLNLSGEKRNLLEIFEKSTHGNPPSAAGECAAPKLLQYAIQNGLKPIALAEFWWGGSVKNKERIHQVFYPACKNRCRPILEYMLEDEKLFSERESG